MDKKSSKPVFFHSQSDLRKWFEKHHKTAEELWVGYHKKGSGKSGLTWPQSVDEALCFGWIDGIRKSINNESYKIRFTPRRKGSNWSTININRIRELLKSGLVRPAGLEVFNNRDEKKSERYSFEQKKAELPAEYERKIKANKKAWEYFQKLPAYAKRLSIWWVISAKKEETRLNRLNTLISCSEEGRKIPPLIVSKKDK